MNGWNLSQVGLWILLAVCCYFYFTDNEITKENVVIGKLTALQGTVQFRLPNVILWHSAKVGLQLTEKSIVSTRHKASAEIMLKGGRIIRIGPNTQIALSSSQNKDSDYLVNVLHGNITLVAKKREEPPRTGKSFPSRTFSAFLDTLRSKEPTQTVQVGDKKAILTDSAAEVSVSNPSNGASQIKVLAGEISIAEGNTLLTATPASTAEKQVPLEPEIEEVVAEQKLFEQAQNQRSKDALLNALDKIPVETKSFFFSGSSKSGRILVLRVNFDFPNLTALETEHYKFVAQLSTQTASVEIVLDLSKKSSTTYALDVTPEIYEKLKSKNSAMNTFVLKFGFSNKDQEVFFHQKKRNIQLLLIDDISTEEFEVSVWKPLLTRNAAETWIENRKGTRNDRVVIRIKDRKNLRGLLSRLSQSGDIFITQKPFQLNEEGMNFVHNGKLLGQISYAEKNKSLLDGLFNYFNADFAFGGLPGSFISIEEFLKDFRDTTAAGIPYNSVFAATKKKLVRIDTKILNDNAKIFSLLGNNVMGYLKSESNAYYTRIKSEE
jgi:hypothetical protein